MKDTLNQRYATISMQDSKQVAAAYETSLEKGIATKEVAQRQAKHGKNLLPARVRHWWRTLLDQFNSPFIYLLLIVCGLMVILGDTTNALIILGIVALNTLFGFYQEYKATQTLQMLKALYIPKIAVIRNGKEIEVASEELVPGDLLVMYPGDIIQADVRFIDAEQVMVDESMLTGESVPMAKTAQPLAAMPQNIHDAQNIGFSGTVVISGKGKGIVLATGAQSALGDIVRLVTHEIPPSLFAQGLMAISKFMVYLTLITVTVLILAHLLLSHGHVSWLELIIFAAALGVSVIPEALPVVTTFCLTRGARRLAKHQVVVKRLSAIEDLGSMQVLCTDKTGTLTENKLTVKAVYGDHAMVIWYGALGSGLSRIALSKAKGFDAAIWQEIAEADRTRFNAYTKKNELPFDPERRRSMILFQGPEGYDIVVRGAPEDVLKTCIISDQEKATINGWIRERGLEGMRTIAIAHKILKNHSIIADIRHEERDMTFIGLIAFEDPIKKTAVMAVKRARELGVAIKILSGDSAEVCGAVGVAVGIIKDRHDVVHGSDFDKASDDEKKKLVLAHHVFARVTPQQKFEIIKMLQQASYVGYMGDGINDAPALRIAHVAMAVDEATDIARDTADIILLRRSLRVIVDGIYEGRTTFVNTLKYLKITLAGNLGNFYAVGIASLFLDYLPMLPTQLLLVNLLSDLPLIALSTDTVSEEEVAKPLHYDLYDLALITIILGLVSTVFDFIVFALFASSAPEVLQTNWFIASILAEVSFIFSIRTRLPFYRATMPSWPLFSLVLLVGTLAIALPYTPFGQTYFHFVKPEISHILTIGAVMLLYFVATEVVKVIYYRYKSG